MVSPEWLPDPAQRLAAQYRDVGVRHTWISASGGRSIVEQMPGQINGYRVASGWDRQGYRGCWVFALGTNDTANVSVGSNVGLMARIREMMSAAHGEPVMWVNTQTDLSSGPWSEANMQRWNSTLAAACRAYPNMRIFNWAALVPPGLAPRRRHPLHLCWLRDPRPCHRARARAGLPGRRAQQRLHRAVGGASDRWPGPVTACCMS